MTPVQVKVTGNSYLFNKKKKAAAKSCFNIIQLSVMF